VRFILALIFLYPGLQAATITSGTLHQTTFTTFHIQGFAAVPFDLEGAIASLVSYHCGNCPVGKTFVWRTGGGGGDLSSGPGTVNGIYYPQLFYDTSFLLAESAPFSLTTATTHTVPFTLTGTLGVFTQSTNTTGPNSVCIVCDPGQLTQALVPATGILTIRTHIVDLGEEGLVHLLDDAVFVINEVPEPSPALLLIAGMSLVVLGRLARRMSRD